MYKKIIGIYQIKNKLNGKIYIGSSINVNQRLNEHKNNLRHNKHPNKHLQSSWNYYKEENFEFSIIEECNKEMLLKREQFYIDTNKSFEREKGYNNRKKAENNLGIKLKYTKKTYKNKCEKMKGKNNPFYGKKHSIEMRKIMGERRKEKGFFWKPSIEMKRKLSEERKGEGNPFVVLTLEKVKEIRELWCTDLYSQNQISKKYNVSIGCIQSIVNNVTWHDPNYIRHYRNKD